MGRVSDHGSRVADHAWSLDEIGLFLPFHLPNRKAPHVDVELVQTRVLAVMSELDLEFHLVASHGPAAYRTLSADARPAPCAVGSAVGELPVLDDFSGFFAD
jgi:hypothetical protein